MMYKNKSRIYFNQPPPSTPKQNHLPSTTLTTLKPLQPPYFLFLIIFICLNIACESPSLKKANKAAANNTLENKVAVFESDLQTMRTAGFDYIFVFRRTDNGVFNAEDKTYLKENSPAATNRFILSDDDKAVIAGSGFEFPPENLEALRKRFNVEDYSLPKQVVNDK